MDSGASKTPTLRRGHSSRVPLTGVDERSVVEQARVSLRRSRSSAASEMRRRTWYDWVVAVLPCLGWLRTYNVRGWIVSDLMAGVSVAAMVIPQGMSYANLAGLPQVYGLYGAFVPCLVYAALGSSRQLAVGPVAVTSTLLGNGLDSLFSSNGTSPCIAPGDPASAECQQYGYAAIQVAFLAGVMYTAIGLLVRRGGAAAALPPI
jgi:sulfate transporter 4